MSSKGKIAATRLEPETGRLQYLLEQDGESVWHYGNDKKFIAEYGNEIKRFVAAEGANKRQRRPVEKLKLIPSPTPKPTRKSPSNSKSSSSSSTKNRRPSKSIIAIGLFKKARSDAKDKIRRIKSSKSADRSKKESSESDRKRHRNDSSKEKREPSRKAARIRTGRLVLGGSKKKSLQEVMRQRLVKSRELVTASNINSGRIPDSLLPVARKPDPLGRPHFIYQQPSLSNWSGFDGKNAFLGSAKTSTLFLRPQNEAVVRSFLS